MESAAGAGGPWLDVAGAAGHLGVSIAFIRRLVLEKRVRYYKVGKFVRFRPADLDAFVEAGRRDPVDVRVHLRSPLGGRGGRHSASEGLPRSTSRPRSSPGRGPQPRADS